MRRSLGRDVLPAFLTDASFYLALFTLSEVLHASGASSRAVAAVFGTYTVAYAAIVPWLGRATDRSSRRGSLIAGSGLFLLTSLFLAGALELTPAAAGGLADVRLRFPVPGGVSAVVYASMAAYALANALFWPALQARIGDCEPDPAALVRAIRRFNVGWTAGKALGFLVGGLLLQHLASGSLAVVGAAAALVLVSVAVRPRPAPATTGGDTSAAAPPAAAPVDRPRAEKRAFLLAGLVANFVLWGSLATVKALAPKLGEALGLDAFQTGALVFAALVAQGVGFVALDRATRWAYRPHLLVAAAPASALGLALVYGADGFAVALLGVVLVGLGQAVTYTASVFYSLAYDGRRGLRTGIHEAVLGAGGALPILGGQVADLTGDLRAPLAVVGVASVVAAIGVAWLLFGGAGRRGGEAA